MTLVLGIESSCDDTAAAVVERKGAGKARVLSSVVWNDVEAHRRFGGVVPEIAARSHVERIDIVIAEAVVSSGRTFAEFDAIAATAGPGLVGGVMVGLTAAKAVALAHGKPVIPVNHLEGHALSVRMTDDVAYPYLLLLVSGGHTQLLHVEGLAHYRRLGTTIDDAAGEAFDKTAKLLGLGQPGGPAVARAATGGRPDRFAFPTPLSGREGCDFSLSGLKTAVRLAAEGLASPTRQDVADIAAGAQAAIAEHLAMRTERAMDMVETALGAEPTLVAAGGVAANAALRDRLHTATLERGWRLVIPPSEYCTDNGAMIAWAGVERFDAGLYPPLLEGLAFAPRARWPLAAAPAGAAFGGGRKGAKA